MKTRSSSSCGTTRREGLSPTVWRKRGMEPRPQAGNPFYRGSDAERLMPWVLARATNAQSGTEPRAMAGARLVGDTGCTFSDSRCRGVRTRNAALKAAGAQTRRRLARTPSAA